jgi:MYXO-CTERM domain-containing protein
LRKLAIALLMLTGFVSSAHAHGVWSHMHVTGWAIENLPEGEVKTFFADPEVKNAALFATVFTDAGYAPKGEFEDASRAYSEHAHWEPFVQSYIEWMIANDPPPWTSIESKKRVAFLMGCAAHGLQDEIFDSLFLHHAEEHDGAGQDSIDPATDGFLTLDGHLRFFPTRYVPMATVLELFESLNQNVTAEVITGALDLIESVYINDTLGPAITRAIGDDNELLLPWVRAHYLDPEIPGSLHSEIQPTARYLEAIWERLHSRFEPDQFVTWTLPSPTRRLVGLDTSSAESWFTVVYGIGVDRNSVFSRWADSDDADIMHGLKGHQWGETYGRLHRLQPHQPLTAGAWYTVTLEANALLMTGESTTKAHEIVVQAPCAEEDLDVCPEVEHPVLSLTGEPPDVVEADPSNVEEEPANAEPSTAEPMNVEAEEINPMPDSVGDDSGSGGCSSGSQSSSSPWALPLLILLAVIMAVRRRKTSQIVAVALVALVAACSSGQTATATETTQGPTAPTDIEAAPEVTELPTKDVVSPSDTAAPDVGPPDVLTVDAGESGTDAGPDTGPDTAVPSEPTLPPTVVSSDGRIVAIGDVHGDIAAARKALVVAEVIDADGHWIGEHTVAVQVGDQLDRGDDEREILDWFEVLSAEAKAAGGAFYPLIGNHEQMNSKMDFRYVTEGGWLDFADIVAEPGDTLVEGFPASEQGRAAAFRPGGPYARILAKHNVMMVVDSTVFVHGGVLPHHVDEDIAALNEEHSQWMMGDGELGSIWSGEDSPLWTRVYSSDTTATGCATLAETLDALGLTRMVVAHTVQSGGINSACDGQVIRVDVGMAAHYGGTAQALEILGDDVWVLQ